MAAAALPIDHAAWRPRYNPWIVAFTVTLATFMEVLDTSIANIALPHIAGSFGASTNESTWVLTSYLVSNGIVLPVSAWLATRFGRKRYLHDRAWRCLRPAAFSAGWRRRSGCWCFFRVPAGNRRRRLAAERAVNSGGHFLPSKARHGVFDLRHGGGAGAGDRPDVRRLDHRQLQLALDFLHQRADQHRFRSI